jgi:dTDP-4-amino-4,6-dideoxygalactose transaminase
MKIPFGKPIIGDEERKAVDTVLRGDILVHGPLAKQFEEAFRLYTGAPYAISCASCTAGLHLAYFYLGIGPGDEVIVPAQTHNATAHAVELCRAKPVFVDADTATGNMDLDKLESAITPQTKAISIVHFLGMPVDMNRVMKIAKKHNLFVVEDCALAIGTRLGGTHAGLFGDVGCFSFYPVKHMTTAEGGMIITKDKKIYDTITRQKAFGVDRTPSERDIPGVYDVTMLGFNYRMNEIEAVLGIEQLKRIPAFLEQRERNYQALERELKAIPELELFQSTHGEYQSSYYCLSIVLKEKIVGKRFEVVKELNANGVGTSVYYPRPVPHFKYYREKYGYSTDSHPKASRISYGSIALPVGPHLNEEHMVHIAKEIKDAIAKL